MAKIWSRERVLSEIQRRHRNGWRINLQHVQQRCGTLFFQANKHCGNWRTAVSAAGIDYDSVRLQKASGTWVKATIITEIQKRHALGLAINSREMSLNHSSLYAAGCKEFGSWGKAVQASGIDYEQVRKRVWGYWNKQTVIITIQQRVKERLSLGTNQIRRGDKKLACLIAAAQEHFGSWRKAIQAAGLNDKKLLRMSNRKWTRAKIIAAIRKRHRAGKSLAFRKWSQDDWPLYRVVMRIYKSRERAIRAAGIDPNKAGGKQIWSKERIVCELRLLHARGESIAPSYLRDTHKPLFMAIVEYFGNWRTAITVAGFDERLCRKNTPHKQWFTSLDMEKTDKLIERTLNLILEEKLAPRRRKRGSAKRPKHSA